MSQPTESERERITWNDAFQEHAGRLMVFITFKMQAGHRKHFSEEDVLQETYLQAWNLRERFHDEADHGRRRWLVSIAYQVLRTLKTYAMVRKVEQRITDLVGHGSTVDEARFLVGDASRASQKVMRSEQVRRDIEFLRRLDDDDRTVILLRDFECLTHAEVAERLGVSEDVSKKRCSRARSRLRALADEAGAAPE